MRHRLFLSRQYRFPGRGLLFFIQDIAHLLDAISAEIYTAVALYVYCLASGNVFYRPFSEEGFFELASCNPTYLYRRDIDRLQQCI